MDRQTQRSTWVCWGAGLFIAASGLAQSTSRPAGGRHLLDLTSGLQVDANAATTQPAGAKGSAGGASVSGVGAIKGNNVIVRSGFSTNYYAVTKLNTGDQVKIDGEEFGWFKIEPPMGTFSLVDKNFVDKMSDKKGVVNGSAQVYAGSNIDERRYAKQVKLSKGAEVALLGETSDGAFYKIEPPPGAHLWVKADFVDRGATGMTVSERKAPAREGTAHSGTIETIKPGELNGTADARPKPASTKPPKGSLKKSVVTDAVPPKPMPSEEMVEKYQMQINAIETEVAAEGLKPLAERQFEPIIAKLQPIADQSEDEVSQLYARTRIEQLNGQIELAAAVREISELRRNTLASADEIEKERERIRAMSVKPTDTIVLRGEIRASGIYNGMGNLPKRWRIVEKVEGEDANSPKTIAYLEVPEGSPIDPEQYYGKFVGIRATSHTFLKGTIPPVPIYQVREIVLNPPDDDRDDVLSTKEQAASGVPVVVTEPTSQPAAAADTTDSTEAQTQPAEN